MAFNSGEGNQLEIDLKENQKINHIIIQKDIEKGERIREYEIQTFTNGKWKIICSGEAVGHKRIHQFDEVECTKIRLPVNESDGKPYTQNFSVFFVE